MTETNLPTPEKSETPHKETIIVAGGLIDEQSYDGAVKKLTEDKALQIEGIQGKTHTDIMNLRIQSYEKRDMPSTQIDDAFRVISGYGNLKDLPNEMTVTIGGIKKQLITTDLINELIYEMLISTQSNLPDGITAEDVSNIGEQSIKNFHEILQFVAPTKEKYENIVEYVKDFGRQLARTLLEKRKTPQR